MKSKSRKTEEGAHKVPSYIVTFSDMVTLLLTFFVMLLSLAEVQDPELFNRGRDSFFESVRYCGLGTLFGKKMTTDFEDVKTKYPTSDPNNLSETRGIDERREKMRRLFKKISQSMTTLPPQIVADRVNFTVTNIKFSPGNATLNEQAKGFLNKFCLDLTQIPDSKADTLYVLGLAGDEATEKQQWILSAKRAQVVSNFIKGTLTASNNSQPSSSVFEESSKWDIFWWGAGPGGDWIGQDNLISKHSHILIAILRTGS